MVQTTVTTNHAGATAPHEKMRIDVWSDVICPWCYIGKRRLEQAIEGFPHRDAVEVVHHAYQLDPTIPRGVQQSTVERLMAKYGSEARVRAMMVNVEQVAAADGLEYHLEAAPSGNTLDAHRLLHLARERGIQDEVLEHFYRAHFTETRSLFDQESLVQLAGEAGLDRDEAQRVLDEGTYADAVEQDIAEAQALGVRGVPFFVLAGRYGVSGAQPAEVFAQGLKLAWAETHPLEMLNADATAPGVADDACADGQCGFDEPR